MPVVQSPMGLFCYAHHKLVSIEDISKALQRVTYQKPLMGELQK